VDEATAVELVRPWAGDSYLQRPDGAESCIAVEIMMDDEPSAKALSEVLQAWAAEQIDAAVDVGGASISLRSCSG
jgi:hypothetical protein